MQDDLQASIKSYSHRQLIAIVQTDQACVLTAKCRRPGVLLHTRILGEKKPGKANLTSLQCAGNRAPQSECSVFSEGP